MSAKIDCKEVSRLISAGLDQDLPEAERARLRYHFVICRTCRTVEEQMRFLRRAVQALGSKAAQDPGGPAPEDPPP